jgi:hypothetical protein
MEISLRSIITKDVINCNIYTQKAKWLSFCGSAQPTFINLNVNKIVRL